MSLCLVRRQPAGECGQTAEPAVLLLKMKGFPPDQPNGCRHFIALWWLDPALVRGKMRRWDCLFSGHLAYR